MGSDLLDLLSVSMSQSNDSISYISQNLANINTNNYKASKLARPFISYLNLDKAISVAPFINHQGGSLQQTGNILDIALSDNTYLKLVSKSGQKYLSRGGNLQLDESGKLVSSEGYMLQGASGEIFLPANAEYVIDNDGNILVNGQFIDQINLFHVENPGQLKTLSLNLYQYEEGVFSPNNENVYLRQGYLEGSNVDSAGEMVELIKSMRHFEATASLVKTYDEMVSGAINTLGEF